MSHPQQVSSINFSPSLPSARPNKVAMQRQYREKESECFNALRDVIRQLTGEELQTRYEVLTKAYNLLASDLETRRQQIQAVPSAPMMDPVDMVFSTPGYSAQQSQLAQPWQNTDVDVENAYYAALAPQQYHPAPNMEPPFAQGDYGEFDYEGWDIDPRI